MARISRIRFVIERKIPRVLRCVVSEEKPNSARRTVQLPQLRLLRRRRFESLPLFLNHAFIGLIRAIRGGLPRQRSGTANCERCLLAQSVIQQTVNAY
jgi:hypothetical protein